MYSGGGAIRVTKHIESGTNCKLRNRRNYSVAGDASLHHEDAFDALPDRAKSFAHCLSGSPFPLQSAWLKGCSASTLEACPPLSSSTECANVGSIKDPSRGRQTTQSSEKPLRTHYSLHSSRSTEHRLSYEVLLAPPKPRTARSPTDIGENGPQQGSV